MELLEAVPGEVWARIFDFLPLFELPVVAMVCRRWREVLRYTSRTSMVLGDLPLTTDDFIEFVGSTLQLVSLDARGTASTLGRKAHLAWVHQTVRISHFRRSCAPCAGCRRSRRWR